MRKYLESELCDGVMCMSNGICGIRPILVGGSEYQSKCLCPIGSDGEYCEKQSKEKDVWRLNEWIEGIIGNCSPTYCLNGGICEERRVGTSTYITCQCQAGWVGSRCQKRLFRFFCLFQFIWKNLFLEYFRCGSSGYFVDEFLKNQGKYFLCAPFNNGLFFFNDRF